MVAKMHACNWLMWYFCHLGYVLDLLVRVYANADDSIAQGVNELTSGAISSAQLLSHSKQ